MTLVLSIEGFPGLPGCEPSLEFVLPGPFEGAWPWCPSGRLWSAVVWVGAQLAQQERFGHRLDVELCGARRYLGDHVPEQRD